MNDVFEHEGWRAYQIESGGYHHWVASKSVKNALVLFLDDSGDIYDDDELQVRALSNAEADLERTNTDEHRKTTFREEIAKHVEWLSRVKTNSRAFYLGNDVDC